MKKTIGIMRARGNNVPHGTYRMCILDGLGVERDSVLLQTEDVKKLVLQLNEMSRTGAPWPRYREMNRRECEEEDLRRK